MQKTYEYLNDTDFLRQIDSLPIQECLVKINLLNFSDESFIDSIEGKITDGSLTKDGSSSARVSCSLSCSVDPEYNIYDINSMYSINKKIFLEIGYVNTTNSYTDIPVIWFPQGVMIITEFSISSSASGAISIQLKFKDKMCLLDGTVGGMLPATTTFDTVTDIVDGAYVNQKVSVYSIIQEAVNHYGGESLDNIVIEDVPLKAKRALKWNSDTPLWILSREEKKDGKTYTTYQALKQTDLSSLGSGRWTGECFRNGHDVGYTYQDFIYDKELVLNAGDTITQLLDTLKNWLGNFEYFYDEFGVFHFREIKNYLNNNEASYEWDDNFSINDYIYNTTNGGITYEFTDDDNIISISSTPTYQNIKNDYVIIGKDSFSNGSADIIYHFVIDNKPPINSSGYDNILLYIDNLTSNYTLAYPRMYDTNDEFSDLAYGEIGIVYGVREGYTKNKYTTTKKANTAAEFYNLLDKCLTNLDDMFKSADFYNYSSSETLDIESVIQSFETSTTLQNSTTKVSTVLAYLIEQYKCGKAKTYPELAQIAEEKIGDSIVITELKNLYEIIYYLSSEDKEYGETTYNNYSKAHYDILSPILNLLGLASESQTKITDLYSGVIKKDSTSSSNYSILYENITEIITILKQRIEYINTYLLKTSTGMYVSTSMRYANLKKVISYLKELKNIVEAILTRAYLALGSTLAKYVPADFIYCDIEVTYNIDTPKFYTWNGNKQAWDEVDWEYYYLSDGGYHNVDIFNGNFENIVNTVNPIPSLKCIPDGWYANQLIPAVQALDTTEQISLINCKEENGLTAYIAKNWRTEIILEGLIAADTGIEQSKYYAELAANWPTMYNLKTQTYKSASNVTDDFYSLNQVILNEETMSYGDGVIESSNSATVYYSSDELVIDTGSINNQIVGNYYFDMLDARSNPAWGAYGVSNIGCRRIVITDDEINCLFAQPLPDYGFIFIENSNTIDPEKSQKLQEESDLLKQNGCDFPIKVNSSIYNYFATGGSANGAYDTLRYNLLTHINYNESISITVRPILYLSPNSLVTAFDRGTGISGKYVINSLTIPLKAGGTMTINASKASEKI